MVRMARSQQAFSHALRRLNRALHELRGGYSVLLCPESGAPLLFASAEFLEQKPLAVDALQDAPWRLVISGVRASRLGLLKDAASAYAINTQQLSYAALAWLADPTAPQVEGLARDAIAMDVAAEEEALALEIAKLAGLLPAVITQRLSLTSQEAITRWAREHHVLAVSVADYAAYQKAQVETLSRVSEAHVPLQGAENTRVIAYRPQYGMVEHLAVVIGDVLSSTRPPLVRLHSSCITGDVLGSLRCDCGAQLRESIVTMAQAGGGVLLYLSQEGRGIGIANKLRAYQLQDEGLDTVDANEEIGFAADERDFSLAAAILRDLQIENVRLMTNNPLKVRELDGSGIRVTERVPLVMEHTAHNRRYLETKHLRCGHLF